MYRERLPIPMKLQEFEAKFEQLKPGQGFEYHSGLLAEDRRYNKQLDQVAELALRMGTDLGLEIDPPADPKFRASRVGTGKALLTQRRNCSGFEYLIQKRSSKH